MHFFVAGLVAIAAVIVIIGAVFFAPERSSSRFPTAGDIDLQDERGVRIEGNGERKKEQREKKPFAWGDLHDGVLTRKERREVDKKGYLRYVVQPGEDLRELAKRYLGNERLSRAILRHNPKLDGRTTLEPYERIKIPLWLKEF